MKAKKMVFLDASTVDAHDVDLSDLTSLADSYQEYATTAAKETARHVGDAEIVLTNKVVIDSETMAASKDLKLICITATGTNNVDLEAAKARNIAVFNVAGYSTSSVTQHTIALLLNLYTGVHQYAAERMEWAASPIFTRLQYPVAEVEGKVLGIVGMGTIGRSVARVAEALGMRVVALARSSGKSGSDWERLPKREFLATCDAVSLHCPLTPETFHLIRAETIGLMKQGAFLINTGRGDLVDEVALAGALKSGRIGGAALDVLSEEPPPPKHPMLSHDVPNLIVTPHSAWAAVEARRRLMGEVAANIRAFYEGEHRNRIV